VSATALGLTPFDLVVWAKSNAGTGRLYQSQHELLPLFKKGSASHVNNRSVGKKGRHRTNVWTYPDASSLGSGKRGGLQDHSTVKPIANAAGCADRPDQPWRYEAATGAVVILADSGETFKKMVARRRNDESDERD
jgi:hypothetical protein